METLLQDLRYTVRTLIKRPGFTVVAILALALGIGANTAIFSVINALLLRPLPFKDPERLVNVWETRPQRNIKQNVVSYPNFADWRDQSDVFEGMVASYVSDFTLTGDENPERLQCGIVSANLFSFLDAKPLFGRTFLPEDEKTGAPLTIILSHKVWSQRYNSDRGIIDRGIVLNGNTYTVIGVMPEGFQFPLRNDPIDLWATFAKDMTPTEGKGIAERRSDRFLRILARLKPGVTLQQAQTQVEAISAGLAEKYPKTNANWGASVSSTFEDLVGDVRPALLILMGAVGFVLLIACANVASLLLARATTRHKEIAIRSALGASRRRIIGQLLTESVVLAIVGGLLGLVFAIIGTEQLTAMGGGELPRSTQINIDLRVLGFTLLVAILTSVLFGLVPALQASKTDLNEALKEGGRGVGEGKSRTRLRSVLVTAEVAIAVVLLVGAGLLLQSLWRLQNVDTGMKPDNLMTMEIGLPEKKYDADQQGIFYHQLQERLSALPGVQAASAVYPIPLGTSRISIPFDIEGLQVPQSDRPSSDFRVVSLDYFRTMGINFVTGRDFDTRDTRNAPGAVVINELFAERFFPGENPLGKRVRPDISFGPEEPTWREIIGVVKSVKHRGQSKDFTPEYYVLHDQMPYNYMVLAVRTTGDPHDIVGAVRNEVQSLDKDLPLYKIRSMEEYLGTTTAQPRLFASLLTIFAALALVLTAIGLYGVISYSVAQRTREIGIRMALGAKPGDVVKLVIKQSLILAVIGIVIGLGGTFLLTRVLRSVMTDLLFGIGSRDPMTLVIIALILAGVAVAACLVPARRATKVDPTVALHYE